MSSLDFLFNGTPPPSTTQYGQVTQNIPQFMTDYTQGLLSQANAAAAMPYQAYGGPRVAGFTDPQTQAFGAVGNLQGAYKDPLNEAQGFANDAGNTSPLQQANPYFQQSSNMLNTAVTDPSSMMNPYVNNVINQAGVLAGQQFQNQILPSIQDNFVKAGQYGSSGMERAVGQATNQTQQALQAQAQSALAGAYTNAQQTGMTGAGQLAQLGSQSGQLGALTGQLQLGAGQQLGALAQTGQNLGLQGAAALEGVGNEQQQLNQQNLGTAYQDFQNQVAYPQQNLNWLSGIIRGQPSTITSQSQFTAPPTGITSPLAQITAGTGSLTGLNALINPPPPKNAKGGHIVVRHPSGALYHALAA
jgi:hypothetical protein